MVLNLQIAMESVKPHSGHPPDPHRADPGPVHLPGVELDPVEQPGVAALVLELDSNLLLLFLHHQEPAAVPQLPTHEPVHLTTVQYT